MREIKFRGISIETKKMVYGDLLQYRVLPVIFDKQKEQHEVYGNTVGQFTGLHDKHGNPIYEGDVVNEFRKSRSFPDGINCRHVIEWEDDMTLDDSYGMQVVGFCMYSGSLEVIGNIYEHPEILEAKHD